MINRVQVSALIAVPLGCIATTLWLAGEPLSWIWLKSYGSAIGITFLALQIFDKWAWKLPFLKDWFVKRPIIEGIWDVEIRSLWKDPQSGLSPPPIVGTASISQTYTKLHLNLQTNKSAGNFVAERIIEKEDGTYDIAGIYINEPRLSLQDKSRPHHGSVLLEIRDQNIRPKSISGKYWTDRATAGEIVFSRKAT